jgi:hypothetical protein
MLLHTPPDCPGDPFPEPMSSPAGKPAGLSLLRRQWCRTTRIGLWYPGGRCSCRLSSGGMGLVMALRLPMEPANLAPGPAISESPFPATPDWLRTGGEQLRPASA